MITGPNRIPLVEFMKAQATESLLHAQQAGEILTGLGGRAGLDAELGTQFGEPALGLDVGGGLFDLEDP